ncbi:hypothetical protein DJ75_08105 [Halorubrum sp. Eb13]|nr:hypothetical protein [Halorubrum sp. Eb13]OYR45324.1 hypothetical protein DJ75_08105 [Halorubrum sp. Eb13]
MGGLFIETVEDRYESVAESQAVDPLASFKRIRNQRSGLRMLGVLRWRDRNRGEGHRDTAGSCVRSIRRHEGGQNGHSRLS